MFKIAFYKGITKSIGGISKAKWKGSKIMKCSHNSLKFLAVTDYRGYIEKLYQCEDCGIPISDFGTEKELCLYQESKNYNEMLVKQNAIIGNDIRKYL